MTALVVYDGVCGFCDRTVRFLLRRDRGDRLRFAAQQSELGARVLARHGRDARALSTLYVLAAYGTPDERILERSRAVFYAVAQLGGAPRAVGWLRFLPRLLTDAGYAIIARLRYRLFGRLDACAVPSADDRAKFLT